MNVKPVYIRCLLLFSISVLSFPAIAEKHSEYGDIIKNKPVYKKITTPNGDDDDDDRHHHHYPYPYPVYPRGYPPPPPRYDREAGSGRSGLPGHIHIGIAIGNSEFDYNDIDDGDASNFHIGYRPRDSRLGYELAFYNTGDAEVTSLTDIEVRVESINLLLTLNSSLDDRPRLNFFGQGGIYFADTTLSGPFDSANEKSNGFLLAAGAEILLNRYFSLRTAVHYLHEVEDFANDESITSITLGGQFAF